jgi:methylmalonyl-CoA/ethylmalonyl-CoA epimerase
VLRKIEHLGIAVQSIDQSLKTFEALLGATCYKIERVESEAVRTAFLMIGESKIELLEASNPDSAIGKFLEKKGQGIHQIAFDVENIFSEIERLKNEGFELIHVSPKDGADNKLIAFLHPKSTEGVLVELCQEKS